MAKQTQVVVRSKAPTVSKKRFELAVMRGKQHAKKAREVAARRVGTLVGVAAGAGAGIVERKAMLSPKFTSPAALGVAGAVLAFVAPETSMGKGKLGQAAAEAGAGLLAVAAYKLGLGQAVIGADDESPAVEGQWQPG